MTTSFALRELGATYGGLTGKSKADFGRGTATYVPFVEVINNTRYRGTRLERVRVAKGERQNPVLRGDLLFNGSSETPEDVALSAVADYAPDADTYLNSFCFGFRLRAGAAAEPTFLAYLFRSRRGRNLVAALAQGATRYNIAKSKFLDLQLALPAVERQREIVEALNDAHELVDAAERVLAKKTAMRRGMLQQLVTGETRLPQFSSPWSSVSVGELLEFKNGLNKGAEYFGSGTPIVNFMDVIRQPVIHEADVAGRVTLTRDEIKRFSAKRGDLFFTRTSETVEQVGTAAVLDDDVPNACFSGFLLRGRPRGSVVDSRFLAHAFQLEGVRSQVTASATYTTRALTNGRSLSKVQISIPSLDEQRAIADVIADADAEVRHLEERVLKYKNIRLGMGQSLLANSLTQAEVSAA